MQIPIEPARTSVPRRAVWRLAWTRENKSASYRRHGHRIGQWAARKTPGQPSEKPHLTALDVPLRRHPASALQGVAQPARRFSERPVGDSSDRHRLEKAMRRARVDGDM